MGYRGTLGLPWSSTHILKALLRYSGVNGDKEYFRSANKPWTRTSSQITEGYAKVIALIDRGIAEKTERVFDIFGNHLQYKSCQKTLSNFSKLRSNWWA